MPIFAGIDAGAIIHLLPAVSTRTYGPGEYIVRHGEVVSALFLIADGRVEVQRGRRLSRLGPGAAFGGEMKIARKTVRAETIVKLLILAPVEVSWLFDAFPEVSGRVAELL